MMLYNYVKRKARCRASPLPERLGLCRGLFNGKFLRFTYLRFINDIILKFH